MATKDTAVLSPPHAPKADAITAFNEIKHDLKKQLLHLRREHDKHEPMSFGAARHLSDEQLTDFSAHDFVLVRTAETDYGVVLFGKLRIPALPTDANAGGPSAAFLHFRAFTEGPNGTTSFHSFHTADIPDAEGHRTFHTLFTEDEPLEWFDV